MRWYVCVRLALLVLALGSPAGFGVRGASGAAGDDGKVAAYPTFDVPSVGDITIDGNADDWGDRGFVVTTFYPRNHRVVPTSDFSAAARFGWDDRGLLVLVRVEDDAAVESPDNAPWNYDSVEFFAAGGPQMKQVLQAIISPGRDRAAGGELATVLNDRRATKEPALAVEVASSSDETGYTVELRLPWAMLGIEPALGTVVAANLQINDRDQRDNGSRYETTWFTTGWAGSGAGAMHKLKLAGTASDPDRLTAGSVLGPTFREQRVFVLGPSALADTQVKVVRGEKAVAVAMLEPSGDHASALVKVPLSGPSDADAPPFRVTAGDRLLHTFKASDPATRIIAAVNEAPLRVRPIFVGPDLPPIAFQTPRWIDVLLGPHTITTTYYDADYHAVRKALKPGRYGAVMAIEAEGLPPMHRYVTLFRAPGVTDSGDSLDSESSGASGGTQIDWDGLTLAEVGFPAGLGLDAAMVEAQAEPITRLMRDELVARLTRETPGGVIAAGLYETGADADAMSSRDNPWALDEAWWLGLKKQLGQFHHRYHTYLPEGYDDPANAERRWPLILFLHGSGERGFAENPIPPHGPAVAARQGMSLPFVIISPQCEPGTWWGPMRVNDLLDELLAEHRIDEDRVYLTGLSMGGHGSWYTAQAFPERFAAVAPICGGGDPDEAARLTGLPIWVFHGGADGVVPVARSEAMVDGIRAAGGEHVALTVYPGVGHNSWTVTYNNPQLYSWLLENRRGQPPVMPTAEVLDAMTQAPTPTP